MTGPRQPDSVDRIAIETQGLVALEANACGTPVVAADAGALKNTVLEGETGYHYPPGDVFALCDTDYCNCLPAHPRPGRRVRR
ncbi:glycosyltransferase [Natrarchaeobius chitinivorans]|uniref:glycosyltransferase n=1 Tax=Natrarchaeobius chitinivorans TaxID=1679083 RepID=UPI0026C1895B